MRHKQQQKYQETQQQKYQGVAQQLRRRFWLILIRFAWAWKPRWRIHVWVQAIVSNQVSNLGDEEKVGHFSNNLFYRPNEYQCKTWCQTAQWWLSSQLPSKALAALQHTFAHRCNHQFFLSTTISRCFWSNTSWRLTSLTVSTSEASSFPCKWRVQ